LQTAALCLAVVFAGLWGGKCGLMGCVTLILPVYIPDCEVPSLITRNLSLPASVRSSVLFLRHTCSLWLNLACLLALELHLLEPGLIELDLILGVITHATSHAGQVRADKQAPSCRAQALLSSNPACKPSSLLGWGPAQVCASIRTTPRSPQETFVHNCRQHNSGSDPATGLCPCLYPV
jgi:hypothetical protein